MKYRNFYHFLTEGDGRTKLYKLIESEFQNLISQFGHDLAEENIKSFCDRTDFNSF